MSAYLKIPKIVGLQKKASEESKTRQDKQNTYAELMKPTSQVLSTIPNSDGKERFAPLAPVLSQPLERLIRKIAI
jgi:hypothetical protein